MAVVKTFNLNTFANKQLNMSFISVNMIFGCGSWKISCFWSAFRTTSVNVTVNRAFSKLHMWCHQQGDLLVTLPLHNGILWGFLWCLQDANTTLVVETILLGYSYRTVGVWHWQSSCQTLEVDSLSQSCIVNPLSNKKTKKNISEKNIWKSNFTL